MWRRNMAVAAMTAHQVVAGAWSRGLQPPPDLQVSDWAAEHVIVTPPSPEPGKWRNERTPYLVDIMNCASPSHPAREIDVMAATQLGKTMAMLNIVGFYSHQSPTSGLIVLPSKDVAREWSTLRLQALFESTPVLEPLHTKNRRRARANTTYSIRLSNGASWKIAWSSSAKVLRSTPAAFILADEVDGFDRQAGGGKKGEGEPITLLRKRFANFRRGKFFRVSSPTDRTGSRIERGFKEGDQRYYFVPCPECNHFQRYDFYRGLRWPSAKESSASREERTAQVRYACLACEAKIPEYRKTEMLARGMWVATRDKPELVNAGFAEADLPSLAPVFEQMARETHPSHHLSALYSPVGWLSWTTVASDHERADDPEALKVFVMTTLAETWVDRGEAPDWEKIKSRTEDYEVGRVPRGVLFLTAGVDVQANRLEVELVGWGRGKQSWSISYHTIPGDTEGSGPWEHLRTFLAQDFPMEAGGTMPITAMAVDMGFRAHKVYEFAALHARPAHGPAGSYVAAHRTVIPVRGSPARWDRLIVHVSSYDAARQRDDLRIVEVGTAWAKQELYDNLRLPKPGEGEIFPAGYCHLPNAYRDEYFQGLCSEARVIRMSGKPEWVRDRSVRNEPLDCRVYARAAASICEMDTFTADDWNHLEARVRPPEAQPLPADGPVPAQAPSVTKKQAPRPRVIPSPYV